MNRQCVVITFNPATNGNQNTIPFNLNFTPNEVIVKQVTHVVLAADPTLYNVWTNMTDQPILCTFHGSASNSTPLDLHFSLSNYSNRSYNFQVQNVVGALVGTSVGILTVVLEFVKN